MYGDPSVVSTWTGGLNWWDTKDLGKTMQRAVDLGMAGLVSDDPRYSGWWRSSPSLPPWERSSRRWR